MLSSQCTVWNEIRAGNFYQQEYIITMCLPSVYLGALLNFYVIKRKFVLYSSSYFSQSVWIILIIMKGISIFYRVVQNTDG